jgi:GrpB-like predicted nucleotidyltransferase (UPF0157 family)
VGLRGERDRTQDEGVTSVATRRLRAPGVLRSSRAELAGVVAGAELDHVDSTAVSGTLSKPELD